MKAKLRRSGAKIMASLIVLLGSLSYIMILAVINGSVGFIAAMGVTVFGATGVAKALGIMGLCAEVSLSWGWIIGIAVGCGVIRGGLRYLEQYSNHYIAFKLLAVLRDKIFGALRVLCPAKLESKQKGSIIAMITSDIETLEVFYAHTISPICIAVLVSLAVFLFVGFVASWYLALVALAGFIVIGIIVPLISSGRLKASGVNYRREFASFNAYFLDSIKGIKDIVLNNAEKDREAEVNRRSDILLKETKKMKNGITKASAATELMVTLFIAVSLIVGILLVRFEMLDLGRMLIGAVTIFGSFGPVLAVSALPGNLTQTFASGDRVLNLLEEKPAVTPVKNGKTFDYENLNVKDLSFAYEANTPVLKDVCLHAEKGEIIGIVGESGCGKSTFLKLLLRFWEKDKGEIDYNGIDVDNIDSDNLLDNVTMVSQTTYLFDESIEENLRIAKPAASQEELENACKMASVHDLSLPEGYKTQVGAMGDNLSAGEKQRIGLARAFLKGSQLILLDEPTSNVDSINEGMILKSLAEQKSKKSIILVSHRDKDESKMFRRFKIKDIVFLAIITACTLVTSAIMPLLIHVPVFGIIQLGLGLQFSIFPVIGLMKVRKAGSMTIMGIFIALFLVMMFPPMALIAVCAVVVELLVFAIFRSYKNDWACVMAGTLYMPLTVPLLWLYYNVNYTVTGEENEAVTMFLGATDPWVIVGMTAAIVVLCFVGSVVGMIISRELKKAGVLKK